MDFTTSLIEWPGTTEAWAFLDLLPVGAYACAYDGRIIKYNHRAAELWGREPDLSSSDDRFCGSHKLFLRDGTYVPHTECAMANVLRTGVAIRGFEVLLEQPDKRRVTCVMDISPLSGVHGEIAGAINCFRDIPESVGGSEQFRQEQEQLRAIIETTPECIKIVARDGTLVHMNPAGLGMVGARYPNEVEGACTYDLIAPEHRDLWRRNHSRVCNGERLSWEFDIIGLSGIRRHMETHAAFLRLFDGTEAQLAITRDMTQRKKDEDNLKASEEMHRVIIEAASDAVVSIDESGAILLANPATTRIFGYEPVELIGKPLTILMPEFMRELHQDGLRRYLATDERHLNWQGTDVTALRKNGAEFPVEVSFREVTSKGQRVFTGFIRDISEKKRAEEVLRASELSLIIETIPGLVWCASPSGELNYLNQRILDYTGTTLDVWAKGGWTNLLHPNDSEPTLAAWSHAVATGQRYELQCRLRRSDGVYRWFHVLGQAARDNAGAVTRWYGLFIDIDDRKSMEEALRDSQARLSRATRTATVGEFAASIAHELSQPLAAVVTNGHACLRWLSAQPPSLGKAHEAAERVVRDGKEAGEVMRRIRALFNQSALEKIELDLNETIGEVLRLLGGETARRHVAVEADLGKNLSHISGDRIQLQQLIFNLLLNGIEAMDPVLDRPRKLSIRSRQSSPETILVEIQDSGAGLEHSEKVFEAFFTTKENGMGMGLAICRSIIDAHHGRLWAESSEGAGATFSFTLPVQSGATS